MKKITCIALGLVLALSMGCQSDKPHRAMRAKAVPPSDFLPNHELLVRQPATFPFHWFYLKENVQAYENVYIAPVDISYLRKSSGWAELDKNLHGKLGTNMQDLSDFMQKAYSQAFAKVQIQDRLKVVTDRNLPKTLVIEPALIALVPTKAELNAIGTVAGFFVMGVSTAASMMSAGSICVECRIRDAATGEIIAMYANTENDPTALVAPASFTWTSSARINIKMMAANTARVLAAKDYRTIRREFPIKLISRVIDGKLDGEPVVTGASVKKDTEKK